jgi:phenylacetate-CoA ligase
LKEKEIDGRLFGLKMVKCTAETILDYQKLFIESVFGCKMVSEYGSAEAGVIAFECPEGGLHLMDDCVYVEFVDESGNPVRPGKKARVVVTNLCNYSMPVLRYELGDMGVASHRSCTCGRGLQLMESVEGRISDELTTPDGKKAHASLFFFIVRRLMEKGFVIKQWRVYQTAVDELKIKIVKGPDFSNKALEYMDKKLHQQLGSEMTIHYEFVADIPRESSGKLKNFVSLLTSD